MISFFDIDLAYADHLRTFESKVPYFDYQGKQKFFCGIVLNVIGKEYYAPVSHNTKPYPTSFLIFHPKTGQPLGSIRMNYMFPVPAGTVRKKDFAAIRAQDPKYCDLLVNELQYCRDHEAEILALAAKIYRRGNNPKDYWHQHCCNFSLLEQKSAEYVASLSISHEDGKSSSPSA